MIVRFRNRAVSLPEDAEQGTSPFFVSEHIEDVATYACRACGKPVFLRMEDDWCYHRDGSDNRPCWRKTRQGNAPATLRILDGGKA